MVKSENALWKHLPSPAAVRLYSLDDAKQATELFFVQIVCLFKPLSPIFLFLSLPFPTLPLFLSLLKFTTSTKQFEGEGR